MLDWKERLLCATECARCHRTLKASDKRILSSYDDEAICKSAKVMRENAPIMKRYRKE